MGCDADEPLVQHTRDSYGPSFDDHLIEQYKLYVQSADNVSSRRVASMRYLLTISSALFALYGVQFAAFGGAIWLVPISIVGIASAFAWLQIIKSNKNLNGLKFNLIHELEAHLPAAPFKREWDKAEQGRGSTYKPVTDLESWFPWVFIVLHAVILVMLALNMAGVVSLPNDH